MKIFLMTILSISFFCGGMAYAAIETLDALRAEDKSKTVTHEKQKEDASQVPLFSVESSDLNASDSLNRISGKYDTGMLYGDSSAKGSEHRTGGAFASQTGDEHNHTN